MQETEYVQAKEIEEGDTLTHGHGVVVKVLGDSGLLTFETITHHFQKSLHAPVERYKRQKGLLYGLAWLQSISSGTVIQAACARAREVTQ